MGLGVNDLQCPEDVLGVDGLPVLIGAGTDGATVNVGVHACLKAKLQSKLPWVSWSRCFAHRLELACKDAFTSYLHRLMKCC